MAYQTSVPANTQGLIDAIISFMVASGGFTLGSTWTFTGTASSPDAVSSVASYTARALSRDGEFITLCWKTTAPDTFYMNSATSISTSLKLYTQAGAAGQSAAVIIGTAPVRYHMFSDGNATHCVVERASGVYVHINLGVISKYGSFTGGIFVSGTYWNGDTFVWDQVQNCRPFDGMQSTAVHPGHLRSTFSGRALGYFAQAGSSALNVAFGLPLRNTFMLDRSPNAYNGRALLIPIELVIGLEANTNNPSSYKSVGRVDNAAYINITNLNPGDTVLSDWMVFPLSAKNSGGSGIGYVNTLANGMAYRK